MNKPTLTVALIVKNEEHRLSACLDSVKDWVDEIVVLDAGSEDKTTHIASLYTDKVFTNAQWPGFGPQRQLAQRYVSCDYVLWLDADERVTAELKEHIQQAITDNLDNTVYNINRLTSAFGKEIKYSGWSPDWVTRLYRTKDTQYNDSLVHESVVVPSGYNVVPLKGRLQHNTFDELHQYTSKTCLYMKSWTDQREGKKRSSLFGAICHGFFRFFKMYIIKGGILDGRHGLLLAILSANTTFIRYSDLWLREYNQKQDKKNHTHD